MAYLFPGMDPYLEGYLWPDVHNALASKIRQKLVPALRPRYAARLNIYLVEDLHPEQETGILYPDVEILNNEVNEPAAAYQGRRSLTPATVRVPVVAPVEVQIPVVEIHDVAGNRLVTCIEIVSPVNKREPGLTAYLRKRRQLYQAGVNILEIDLLRRATRVVASPPCAYVIALTRAGSAYTELWPLALPAPLPVAPVPLLSGDEDVPLDLQEALEEIYEEAAYDLSVDYRLSPPPPELSEADMKWLRERIAATS
jgi:hypothetical protein